jgi:hypothetical protein
VVVLPLWLRLRLSPQDTHLSEPSSGIFCAAKPQNKELTGGPPELVQHFSLGILHRRKSAACPTLDMVWLYRTPILVGRRRVISSFKLFLPVFGTSRGGGRESAPCALNAKPLNGEQLCHFFM